MMESWAECLILFEGGHQKTNVRKVYLTSGAERKIAPSVPRSVASGISVDARDQKSSTSLSVSPDDSNVL